MKSNCGDYLITETINCKYRIELARHSRAYKLCYALLTLFFKKIKFSLKKRCKFWRKYRTEEKRFDYIKIFSVFYFRNDGDSEQFPGEIK